MAVLTFACHRERQNTAAHPKNHEKRKNLKVTKTTSSIKTTTLAKFMLTGHFNMAMTSRACLARFIYSQTFAATRLSAFTFYTMTTNQIGRATCRERVGQIV